MRSFRHTTGVLGAQPSFRLGHRPAQARTFSFSITAEENARVEAKIVRVPAPTALSASRRGASSTSFDRVGAGVAEARGKIAARWTPVIRFSKRRLDPGWYVYAVKVTAELNADRRSIFVSDAFQIG
jgi:hypothetical protein